MTVNPVRQAGVWSSIKALAERVTGLERHAMTPGPWTVVGVGDGPAYENSWVKGTDALGDTTLNLAYRPVGRHFLEMIGVCYLASGSVNSTIFTMPEALRPQAGHTVGFLGFGSTSPFSTWVMTAMAIDPANGAVAQTVSGQRLLGLPSVLIPLSVVGP